MGWYFARIWIEITPLHLRWWPSRHLDQEPQVWHAPAGTAGPLSDPAPPGAQPRPWLDPPRSWRESADAARDRLVLHDLTVIDANGFPLCLPVSGAELVEDGFKIHLGPGAPTFEEGPACLTMHSHPEVFTGQENRTFVGRIVPGSAPAASTRLVVDRALADWSIAGNRAQSALGFLRKGRLLAPRLRAEAERRAQPVPQVRFPSQA